MVTSQAFWDSKAEGYARSPIGDMDAYEHTLARVRACLKPGDRVLELGCGTGMTALKLADAVADYTASDESEAMVRIGRAGTLEEQTENLRFVRGVPGDAALGEGYDVILAFNLLHLLQDLPGALAHVRAMLKPGGLFISKTFCTPEQGGTLKYRAIRLALPVMQVLGKAPFVRFMSIAELERDIRAAGFTIAETGNFPAVPPRRFIVAERRDG